MASPGAKPYDKEAEVAECGCTGREGRELPSALERDLATSYRWSGEFCRDYGFFIANWHPLLGMFCSHPAHPWSKQERVLTFMVSCSLTMLPSAVLLREAERTGSATLERMSHFTVFVFVTLPVMLLEIVLYYLAILKVYGNGKKHPCCTLYSCLVRATKGCCLGMALFASACAVLLSLAIVGTEDVPQMLRPFVKSRVQSWLIWFPLWFFMPYLGFLHYWHIEQRQAPKTSEQPKEAPAQCEASGAAAPAEA